MLTQVRLRYFKKFLDETFLLDSDIVLAGQNNSGKTTLLQAMSRYDSWAE
jgi:predicted ATP-dependent endonuclease of OLD family